MAKNTNTTNTNIINKVTKPFAKCLTILDLVARLALGIAVWFVPVPKFMVYAATFLGAVAAFQTAAMLWKAQK